MDQPAPSPRAAFWKSPHHAILALATLGTGFATGEPLYLLLGATGYTLGWIYVPDFPFFRRWMEGRQQAATLNAHDAEAAAFVEHRGALIAALLPRLRQDYEALTQVCRDIERASLESDFASDARLSQLDELMWMYLRLLTTEQSLVDFLEADRDESLSETLQSAETEVASLAAEVEKQKAGGVVSDSRERLLHSRQERIEVLRKRLQRQQEAQGNLEVVRAEEERLAEQIKLIRADALATKSSAAVSARIDASVAQLNETGRWLSEVEQYQSLAEDPPLPQRRVGFGAAPPPPPPLPPRQKATE